MKFFSAENSVWKPLGQLADLFLLSLVWLLCCLPVVTAGASTAALYDAVARGFRKKEPFPLSRFRRSFKNGLGCICLTTLCWAPVYALCVLSAIRLVNMADASKLNYALSWAGVLLLLLPLGTGMWLAPLHSRFSFNAVGLSLTALRLALSKVHITLLLAVSAVIALLMTLHYVIPIFIFPALLMLLWSYLLEPVFTLYENRE